MKSPAATPTPLNHQYRSRIRPPAPLRSGSPTVAPVGPAEDVTLSNGRTLVLRPIAASDVVALQRGFAHLSQEEVRMRFLHLLTELPDPLAHRLCDIDPRSEIALVLVDPLEADAPEIHAVARAVIDDVTHSAEFALVVQKALTGQGLGELLMRRLIKACREHDAEEIWGDVLAENHPMLALCERLGFERAPALQDPGMVRVSAKI